jgi:hypothetical protein
MGRRSLSLAALWVAVGISVAAADFWEDKPFRSWSGKDVEKMLTDSPWADEVAVSLPPRLRQSQGGGRGGGFSVAGPGGGGGGGGGGRNRFPGPRRVRMAVSWRSALPVKQALLREQIGEVDELSAENEEYLERDTGFYVIGVLGVPAQFARIPTDEIRLESFLKPKDKEPIPADDVLFQRAEDGLLLVMPGREQERGVSAILLVAFSKINPLILEDQEVEFIAKLGDFSIKKKFKLKDMVLQGELAL